MFPNTYNIVSGVRFARPADTTAYASGDIVANSTTAGSVVPVAFADATAGPGFPAIIKRIQLLKSAASATNATFRVHLFTVAPTVTSGDNAAIVIATGAAGYLGQFDIASMQTFTDGAAGFIAADVVIRKQTIYALLEARGAYTPASAETFTLSLEVAQQ